MKKVKHILTTFIHSVIPQDVYYPKLLHTRFLFSLKYYVFIITLLALTFTGLVFCQFSPLKMISYKNSIVNSLSAFPEEVKITIKNGVLESNQNKPLFLWIYHNKQPLFVFMIHTTDTLSNSHIPLPIVFLGADKVQISYRGHIIVRSYDSSWNVAITKERILPFISSISSSFPPFMFFFYLFMLILVPLAFILSSTFFIFLSSLLVFTLLRTFIPHIHIKKCFQAGMHGTHIPLLVIILLYSLFPTASNIFVIATALIFVFSLVSTYEMYSKEVAQIKGR
ncbi:MAG: DUF1189 family protein [Candidatus Roizmanbacteria bacterium]|nr:DUF1189 family protein [Candidatus Roizmanbacteria bacterium]